MSSLEDDTVVDGMLNWDGMFDAWFWVRAMEATGGMEDFKVAFLGAGLAKGLWQGLPNREAMLQVLDGSAFSFVSCCAAMALSSTQL